MGRVANKLLLHLLELTWALSVMQFMLKVLLTKEFTLQEIQENIKWGTSQLADGILPCVQCHPMHPSPGKQGWLEYPHKASSSWTQQLGGWHLR
jgi:hypothetical protein